MNRLKGTMCYLSGPMDRVADGGIEWRADITPWLLERGIGVLNPCDKPSNHGLETAEDRALIYRLKEEGQYDKIYELLKPVVGVDLRMVDIAHFLIAYIDIDVHMCGTYDELFMAALQRKPIIIMCKQGKQHVPNWLFGRIPHKLFFSSWDEVKEYIDHVRIGSDVDDLERWRFFDFDKVFGGYCGIIQKDEQNALRV